MDTVEVLWARFIVYGTKIEDKKSRVPHLAGVVQTGSK
jgi:hypothetical protein